MDQIYQYFFVVLFLCLLQVTPTQDQNHQI